VSFVCSLCTATFFSTTQPNLACGSVHLRDGHGGGGGGVPPNLGCTGTTGAKKWVRDTNQSCGVQGVGAPNLGHTGSRSCRHQGVSEGHTNRLSQLRGWGWVCRVGGPARRTASSQKYLHLFFQQNKEQKDWELHCSPTNKAMMIYLKNALKCRQQGAVMVYNNTSMCCIHVTLT